MKLSLIICTLIVITACNSSNTTSSGIDNYELAEGKNEYGYFGEDVIFGSSTIVGTWEINSTYTPDEIIIFLPNGITEDDAMYGLSIDGTTLTILDDGFEGLDPNGKPIYDKTREVFTIEKELENECYEVTLELTEYNEIQDEVTTITIEYYHLSMCKIDEL